MRNKIIGVLTFLVLMPSLCSPQEKRAFSLDEILNLGLSHNPWLLAKAQEVEAKKSVFFVFPFGKQLISSGPHR